MEKLKIVVLGASGVGKTTLFQRLMGSVVTAKGDKEEGGDATITSTYAPSTTANIGAKLVHLERFPRVVIEVWDVPYQIFAGSAMYERYIRGAKAFVLMFAMDPDAMAMRQSWQVVLELLRSTRDALVECSSLANDNRQTQKLPIVIVGNKRDVIVTAEAEAVLLDIRAYCQQHDLPIMELSARENPTEPLQVVKILVSRILTPSGST